MTPEIIKCLCELNSNNHLQSEESLEDWFKRLTQIAYNIAQTPNSHPEILAILAKDSDLEVRWFVAKNPITKSETLMILAKDSNWRVRYKVAENLNTHPETLAILAKDSDWQVRFYVAKNPNTSSETLAILAGDFIEFVSKAAQKQLKQRANANITQGEQK